MARTDVQGEALKLTTALPKFMWQQGWWQQQLPQGVQSILTGTLGTGTAWPSAARGTTPLIASNLAVASLADMEEKNGFTLVDLSQDEVTVRLLRWHRDEPEPLIDDLEPCHAFTTGRA